MSVVDSVLEVETEDRLTIARLHWPGNRASAGLSFGSQLDGFFERERDHREKVIVLIATQEVVDAANLELRDPLEGAVDARELMQRLVRRENLLRRLVTTIRSSEPFIVAALDGSVALRMAGPLLACDYRIASARTTFRFASRRTPVAPAGGVLWFLNRILGPAKTMEMALRETPLDATEALHLGLVNAVTTMEGFEDEALAEARRLTELPVEVLHQLKRSMVNSCECLEGYFDREVALLSREENSLLRGLRER